MTFSEVQTAIKDRLNYTSSTTDTRLGNTINRIYRQVGTEIGINFARQTNATKIVTIASATVVFSGVERIDRVWYLDSNSKPHIVDQVLIDELRNEAAVSSDQPTLWALLSTTSNTVSIRLDANPETAYTLYCDGVSEVADLSGSNEPAFPESFHDILVEGVLREEYLKLEKPTLADRAEAAYEKRLSGLRMFMAKTGYMDIYQGKKGDSSSTRSSGGGVAAQAVLGPASSTDNAIVRFNGTGGTSIQNSGITVSDAASGALSGTNTGDVTLAGTPDYITISSQVITRGLIDLATDVTGVLPTANLADDSVTDAKLRESAALTVIGRAANSTGNPADIAAASNNLFLARASDALAFQAIDHGANVSGLSDDDHTQYALLAGRSGGQVITGGTASGDDITLRSTSNATKGDIFLADAGGNVVLGGGTTASELRLLEPSGSGTNYTAFKTQAQTGDITYTLPPDDGDAGEFLKTDGAGSLTWEAPSTAVVMTLLKAGIGSTTNAAAETVDSIALSGLTNLDTLIIEVSWFALTQQTAQPLLYHVTDAATIIALNGGAALAAGNDLQGTATLRQRPGTATQIQTLLHGFRGSTDVSTGGNASGTAWTSAWTLGLRHGGVTVGGTGHWSWAVYKVVGQ